VLGKRTDLLGSTGFTDARIYVLRAGTPAILLGPGNISQAHTVNEFVSVESLRRASVLFAMITADFFGALRQ
jgi:acetylornithine deacetylase/succinyl-diaminopimelate desuccinylase-like protein